MNLNLATWGNALHSGKRTYPIVQQRKRWFLLSFALMAISVAALAFIKLSPGIDFRGGTEFNVADAQEVSAQLAIDVIEGIDADYAPRAVIVGSDKIRVQMQTVEVEERRAIRDALAEAYDVEAATSISASSVGSTWGADVTSKALKSLIIFLIFDAILMTLYFRAWRMASAALIALLHDLVFTAGIYAVVGFEVTPASVIGFLTILGYSLYDTVVVFDKVRENTDALFAQHRFTYGELANLAINQTLVRSINTSVVALLPVSAILFIGSNLLGAGTLSDISLALFVGMAVGTYSSIFVATPMLVSLRASEAKIVKHTAEVMALRESGEANVAKRDDGTVFVGALKPGGHLGTAAQPKRAKRRK